MRTGIFSGLSANGLAWIVCWRAAFASFARATACQRGRCFCPTGGDPWNLDVIHVSQVHEELAVKGEGVVIGQTDSGVDGTILK